MPVVNIEILVAKSYSVAITAACTVILTCVLNFNYIFIFMFGITFKSFLS